MMPASLVLWSQDDAEVWVFFGLIPTTYYSGYAVADIRYRMLDALFPTSFLSPFIVSSKMGFALLVTPFSPIP
jgi:hypothetical protein